LRRSSSSRRRTMGRATWASCARRQVAVRLGCYIYMQ
jgi:hypothetical protein